MKSISARSAACTAAIAELSASPRLPKKSNPLPPFGTRHPPEGSAPIARSWRTLSSIERLTCSALYSPTGMVMKNGPCSPTKYCTVRTCSLPPPRLNRVPSLTFTLVTSLGCAIVHAPMRLPLARNPLDTARRRLPLVRRRPRHHHHRHHHRRHRRRLALSEASPRRKQRVEVIEHLLAVGKIGR